MNKIIAVYLGPTGLALIGQFQNFVGITSSIANGSIQTGMVKYIAEYKEDKNYLSKLLQNALFITLFLSIIIMIFLYLFADVLSNKIMFSSDYTKIIYFLSFSIIFYSLNLYVLSILNGLGEIRIFTIINILISIINLFSITILTVMYNLNGALIAIVITQSLVFIITYIIVYRKYGNDFFRIKNISKALNKKIIMRYFKFACVTFSSGLIISIMMISIRNIITSEMTLEDAGIWEGTWKLITYFNMLFMLPFSVYYLPKFSSSKSIFEIKNYLYEAYKFIVPLTILLGIFIYIFKNLIVTVLFSDQFYDIQKIVGIVIFAEIIRILGLIISNIFLSKAYIRIVILCELSFALQFTIISFFFIKLYALQGIAYAYALSSIMFFIVHYYIYIKFSSKNNFLF